MTPTGDVVVDLAITVAIFGTTYVAGLLVRVRLLERRDAGRP